MNIFSVIVASVLTGLLLTSANYISSGAIEAIKSIEEKKRMEEISEAVIAEYDKTGEITTNIKDLQGSLVFFAGDGGLKDATGNDFAILKNGTGTFNFQGGGPYRFAIVAPGSDGVDSSITANALIVKGREDVLLVSEDAFKKKSKIEVTRSKLQGCNSAYTNYVKVEGVQPAAITDLVASGYIDGQGIMDGWGYTMKIDGANSCYSVGYNGTDEGGSGDDIK